MSRCLVIPAGLRYRGHQVVQQMVPYIEAELASGNQLSHITRHMLGLFQGVVGARLWRRHLSENAGKRGVDTGAARCISAGA